MTGSEGAIVDSETPTAATYISRPRELSPVPDPGEMLVIHEQFKIILAFRAMYRVRTVGRPGTQQWAVPSWTAFPGEAVRTDPSVLKRLAVGRSDGLLLYVEGPLPGRVLRTTFGKLVRYFDDPNVWVSIRCHRYVLPYDLSWCMAFTDDNIGPEQLVLLAGPVPLTETLPQGVA